MNKSSTLKSVFTFLIGFLFLTLASSQFEPARVDKSEQKIIFQGKTYYVHTVKPGQTLYSICKAYGVSQSDIANANPGVVINPLSVGLALKIPVAENVPDPTKSVNQPVQKDDDKFIYHTVSGKETVFFLHKKYGIPIEDIYRYNPEAEKGISVGQVIRIPKVASTGIVDIQPIETNGNYIVRQGDTLFRIAETFGVTINELIIANKDLRWGLKAGQVLVIPLPGQLTAGTLDDSILNLAMQTQLTKLQCDSIAGLQKPYQAVKIAILLPFFANEDLSVADTTSEYTDIPADQKIRLKRFWQRASAEIYEGTLLAIDSLRKNNLNMSMYTYDTRGDTNTVKKIIRDLEILEPELIIGPLEPECIEIVSKFSFEKKIPFIPPIITSDSLAIINPYLFRITPYKTWMFDKYADIITGNKQQENYVLAIKPSIKPEDNPADFRKKMISRLQDIPGFDTAMYNEVAIGDRFRSDLMKTLKKDTLNKIIIFSTYEPDVIYALSNIHALIRDYPFKVYGFPAWQKYENLRIDVIHELQVTLYAPFYIDYNSGNVKQFIKKCRDKLGYEPYKTTSKGIGINYTYLGYDLAMYFIQAANIYQDGMCDCIQHYSKPQLLSDYHFSRIENMYGFINTGMSIVNYNKDYRVESQRTR